MKGGLILADIVNGLLEMSAGFFVLDHCRHVLREKSVRGVSIPATMFFTTWGVWNLYYYPSLGQWASAIGGLFVVSANLLWVVLLLRYKNAKVMDES